jgi:acetyl-CoA synthetase
MAGSAESAAFLAARDLLLRTRTDYQRARAEFRWPALDRFNWALDYFDRFATGNQTTGLELIRPDGSGPARTFGALVESSNRLANLMLAEGVTRGDRLLLMLPNSIPIWETMLAAMKLGVVVIPATPQLTRYDLEDRFARGGARHVVTDIEGARKLGDLGAGGLRLLVGGELGGWRPYDEHQAHSAELTPPGVTKATDPLLLYFTSGTTAKPKLVLHTHQSYPVGHLTTMYWLGVRPGDRHLNISSPGWAKHAYSSFFAPWNAGATVLVFDQAKFDAAMLLQTLIEARVTTLCAPPTVWRMLISEDLSRYQVRLREALSAGEPLNPEVIQRVEEAWGITIRDGYGQTETTVKVGNTPGQPVRPGSMGRPMPGYEIALRPAAGSDDESGADGEISVALDPAPTGVMVGYLDDPSRMERARAEGFYRTGDVAVRDADGYITYVGRADDVFKSSDYRISPFELESVLIEHPAVAEAAVVESPDPIRLVVPKAFVALRPGHQPSRELAVSILRFVRQRVPPYGRVRRLEFSDLPKTISGKIRRVELRQKEKERHAGPAGFSDDYAEERLPELKTDPNAAR